MRIQDGVARGGEVGDLSGRRELVEFGEQFARVVVARSKRYESIAKPADRRGGVEAVANDVANTNSEPTVGQRDGVVPVAAHLQRGCPLRSEQPASLADDPSRPRGAAPVGGVAL